MLMGVSLVYGATGSVFLEQIDGALAGGIEARQVAVAGTLLTVVGLAFKVAAVPFHMWVPDTYVGAPVAVAAYLSVVSKAAGFAGLILVLDLRARPVRRRVGAGRGVLAALTMTVGNVLALRQRHAIRLLAWSSVAQAGYILVPFGAAASGGRVVGASMGYLAIYAFLNLSAFAVAAVVGTRYPAQRLSDYRGLVRDEPGAGWPLAFALVALAGLPPGVVGLLAKVVVLRRRGRARDLAGRRDGGQRRDRAGLLRPLAGGAVPAQRGRGRLALRRTQRRRGGDRHDVHRRCGVLGLPRLAARPVLAVLR